MTLILIALAIVASTLAGGLLALRFKDKLHLILGFSAGAVVGLAFFELLPEALELGAGIHEPATVFMLVALGFACYMVLDRSIFLHSHVDEHCHHHNHGSMGAGTLTLHSFMDGLSIGLSFQVSPTLGWVVTLAVLAHDFSDGLNTVNMVLKNKGNRTQAFRWLLLDAAAPVAGIVVASMVQVSTATLATLLAVFAGFFLYIGASDLIPESHHAHPKRWTTISTLLGMALMYGVIQLAE